MAAPSPVILERKLVYRGEFLCVYKLNVQVGAKTTKREVIERRDGVAIVPIDVNYNVLLIKEFSAGSNSFLYTLPGGHIDQGESPEAAARRELFEETGYRAKELIKLRYAYSHPAISTRRSYTFMAYDLILEDPHHRSDEFIEVFKIPLEKAMHLVYRDFESDLSTIGNLLMSRDKLMELDL
jgi:ADP-ribose pyrophosphatase